MFHNSNVFGSCIIHLLYTGRVKIKKIIPAPKEVAAFSCSVYTVSGRVGERASECSSRQTCDERENKSRFLTLDLYKYLYFTAVTEPHANNTAKAVTYKPANSSRGLFLTALMTKIQSFWNVIPCQLVNIYQYTRHNI